MKSLLLKLFLCVFCMGFFATNAYSLEKGPAEVCASFMHALLVGDFDELDALIVPTNYSYLLKDENFLLPLRDALEMLSNANYHTLTPGDMILLRGDEEFRVTEDMVTEDRAVIFITMLDEPLSYPFYLYKMEGSWKVDSSPVIESRLVHYYQVREEVTENQ